MGYGKEGNRIWYKEAMRAPRNRFNIYLEYIWQDSKGIGSWFAKQAEWIHCKPDWRSLAHKGYPEPETSRQEAECWFTCGSGNTPIICPTINSLGGRLSPKCSSL